MKCAACKNEIESKIGTIPLRIAGKLWLVKNVCYEECPVCGEYVLTPEVSQDIFKKIKEEQYSEEMIKVSALDFAV